MTIDWSKLDEQISSEEPEVVAPPTALMPVDYTILMVDAKAALEKYRPDFEAMIAEAHELEITDEHTNNRASELVLLFKNFEKEMEKIRKDKGGDAKKFYDDLGKLTKSFTSPIANAGESVKRKLVAYKQLQEHMRREREMQAEKARRELQAKLDAEAKEKGFEAIEIPAQVISETTRKIVNEVGSVTFRKIPRWRVVDEKLIPRAYLVPDEKGITAAQKAGLTVPGIEFYEEEIPVRR